MLICLMSKWFFNLNIFNGFKIAWRRCEEYEAIDESNRNCG